MRLMDGLKGKLARHSITVAIAIFTYVLEEDWKVIYDGVTGDMSVSYLR